MFGMSGKNITKSPNKQLLTFLRKSMNEYDKNNLDFLLSLDPKGFELWFSQASTDDLIYSMELIRQFKKEIKPFIETLNNDLRVDALKEYKEAKQIIEKIK
jgi:hypothetical protein